MKLPIDNFSLLGVGLGTDAPGVLRALQRKIEKPAVTGFSEETLEKRKGILMRASTTLLDKQLRERYEEDLKMNSEVEGRGFEVDEGEEVAGLMLLLEEGFSEECLHLGAKIKLKRGYIVESHIKEKEIELLIDSATVLTAENYKGKRYYEKAAEIIETRLKEKKGGNRTVRTDKKMEDELVQLTPYRILDLVSREDSEVKRGMGIKLLEELIERRGGLDGQNNEVMGREEFLLFVRQIRMYLTVQEQIDVFKKEVDKGSQIGKFLYGIVLVASGFTQRKPERLKEAIKVLENIHRDELEPIIGNIYLLLGDIKTASIKFSIFAEPALKEWCEEITSTNLGQMCAWCEEWLKRDVLIGYRDIETEANIDAYFNDKDVIAYIEKQDGPGNEDKLSENNREYRIGMSIRNQKSNQGRKTWKKKKYMGRSFLKELKKSAYTKETLGIVVIITLLTGTLALFAQVGHRERVKGSSETMNQKKGGIDKANAKRLGRLNNDIEMIEDTIAKWHTIKRDRLAGKEIAKKRLGYISERRLLELEKEALELQRKGRIMNIDVKIKEIKSIEQKGYQTIVEVVLDYGETMKSINGDIIKEMPRKLYRRTYKLIKGGQGWVVD
jgi:hypothetical protein